MTNIWDQVLVGNIAGVRALLEDEVGVDERNWLGETPLHLAARYGLEDMATVRTVDDERMCGPVFDYSKMGYHATLSSSKTCASPQPVLPWSVSWFEAGLWGHSAVVRGLWKPALLKIQ